MSSILYNSKRMEFASLSMAMVCSRKTLEKSIWEYLEDSTLNGDLWLSEFILRQVEKDPQVYMQYILLLKNAFMNGNQAIVGQVFDTLKSIIENNFAPFKMHSQDLAIDAKFFLNLGDEQFDKRVLFHTIYKNMPFITRRIMMEELSTKPLDVNIKDEHGRPPLFYEICFGNIELAEIFINLGSKLEFQDVLGQSYLHLSSLVASVQMTKLLVASGMDINAKDDNGKTPLHNAVLSRNRNLAQLILNVSTHPVKHPDKRVDIENNIGVLDFLIESGAKVNCQDAAGKSPLGLAILLNDLEMCKLLIAKGADVNLADKQGHTALHQACRIFPSLQLIKLILSQGADVNKPGRDGRTPIFHLPFYHHEIWSLLLCLGAEVNKRDKYHQTVLHRACLKGSLKHVHFLLRHGASAQSPDYLGNTPLKFALRCGRKDIVELILKNEKDLQMFGNTDVCSSEEWTKALCSGLLPEFLAERLAKMEEPLTPEDCNKHFNSRYDARPNKMCSTYKLNMFAEGKQDNGFRLHVREDCCDLHTAIAIGSLEWVAVCIERQEVNICNRGLPLHRVLYALRDHFNKAAANFFGKYCIKYEMDFYLLCRKYSEIFKKLVEAGADLTATNEDGLTVFHIVPKLLAELVLVKSKYISKAAYAIDENSPYQPRSDLDQNPLPQNVKIFLSFAMIKILQLALDRGAPVDLADNEGFTPLFHALMWEDTELEKFWLRNGADLCRSKLCLKNTRLNLDCNALKVSADVTRWLTEKGKDVTQSALNSTLMYALARREEELLHWVAERGGQIPATREHVYLYAEEYGPNFLLSKLAHLRIPAASSAELEEHRTLAMEALHQLRLLISFLPRPDKVICTCSGKMEQQLATMLEDKVQLYLNYSIGAYFQLLFSNVSMDLHYISNPAWLYALLRQLRDYQLRQQQRISALTVPEKIQRAILDFLQKNWQWDHRSTSLSLYLLAARKVFRTLRTKSSNLHQAISQLGMSPLLYQRLIRLFLADNPYLVDVFHHYHEALDLRRRIQACPPIPKADYFLIEVIQFAFQVLDSFYIMADEQDMSVMAGILALRHFPICKVNYLDISYLQMSCSFPDN